MMLGDAITHDMFAKAQVKRVIKRAGAERVSEGAVLALSRVMEDEGLGLTSKAIAIARYTGRQTLQKGDFEISR